MTDEAELPPGTQLFYPIREMSRLIALRVNPSGEEMRTTVDKVRKRLVYAVDHDELHLIGPAGLQLYFVPEVLAWARRKWPEAFADLSVKSDAVAQSHMKLADELHDNYIPADPEKRGELLQEAYRTIDRLERDLTEARRELERLRPLAEKYEQNREKNRSSAKRPRNDR